MPGRLLPSTPENSRQEGGQKLFADSHLLTEKQPYSDGRLAALTSLTLMPHSRCNCRCVMCDIWKANRDLDEISFRVIEKHRQDFMDLGIRSVLFTGGEPLMHDGLWQICRMLKEINICITLMSSGLLLAQHAENIVQWCDEVVIPIEGDEATHDRLRNVPNSFIRMTEGVRALRNVHPAQRITAQSVIQRQNFAYLPDMIRMAIELNLDGISLCAIDTISTAFNRPQGLTREKADAMRMRPVDIIIFKNILDHIRDEFRSHLDLGFIVGGKNSLRKLVVNFENAIGADSDNSLQCNIPWHSAIIEATGRVKPCAFHKAYGSIRRTGLADILNSEEAVSFRQELDVTTNAICRSCTAQKVYSERISPESKSRGIDRSALTHSRKLLNQVR